MELHDIWFILIAVLWTGYFFLEGFDFGIGVLTKLLARDRRERRVLINTIGPVWDGNEVWLLSAGGATFAAFPEWYATLFSGFYLPLLLILVCLIVRGVAFEYRVKRDEERWQRNWEHAIFWCSLLPAFLWGVAFGNIVHGVQIDAHKEYVGSVLDLLNPYALLGGLVTLSLFTFHGAVFASLKTLGDIRERARRTATVLGLITAVLAVGFLGWTQLDKGDTSSLVAMIVAVLALVAGLVMNRLGREGWSFAFSGVTIVAAVAMLFLTLFPNVMPSSLNDSWSLTVSNASSSAYTLKIMTWCAGIATPVVMLYQGWTYWVFRKRIGTQHIADAH
ncbi:MULTISPECIES: cytochrome d ubiquinol oxidase subunit II [Streptomyces]|uniref:Cytochrome d ubiquinol oxidase subunit II n=2 Tax=Streptomyces rimosus subsp. rimosus TaxID=132474 RepID=L8F0T4_STRR1|nr:MULTISPECIES: cytochrome d ubiquinol oxidase subunit II [Streptomyces]KOG71519.1 cytochrome C oxidase assembly protein [Kitasatospora aureofaciens]MYT47099.1 cytochrome d ubiquinol oxidase subunit II [Streptomyces sp. SID5471]KEF08112.1 cytochrome C oxidase assembly protein [Streptomyces rimosus]KOT29919.1 cytochrome C oxidase assembly protein [Streptomyces rimosus subsp. rimosus]KOT47359.1 cytochrome C oxidase assembly protein [Streptomyces sp. NRRL WC-3701]